VRTTIQSLTAGFEIAIPEEGGSMSIICFFKLNLSVDLIRLAKFVYLVF
jgi:hypothetical protein